MKKNIRKIIAAALGICTIGLFLTGCNTKNNSASEAQGKESKSDVLTFAVGKEVDSLYTLNMNTENYLAAPLVYETLVEYDNGSIKPKLAESYEWNSDNTVLTFRLRKDVTFHDGEKFNAEAVKKNLEFYHSDSNFSAVKAFADLTKVEAVDEYTVKVYYPHPSFSYLNDYCFQNVAGMASPKAFEDGNFQTMTEVAGTGPYIYDEFVSGDCVKFKRNESYWGDKPKFSEVDAKYIPDASSRIQALKTGEVDLIYGSSLLSYDDYNSATEVSGIEGKINKEDTLTRNLVFNAGSKNLSDLKVRKAAALAINKKEITEGLTFGYETPADKLFIKNVPYSDTALDNSWDYNLEEAQKLLDEAGWKKNDSTGIREKDGKVLKLNYTYWQDIAINKEIALSIKNQLLKAGIDVETQGEDQMTWWTDGAKGNYDITMWNTEVAYTAPHKFFVEMLGTDPHATSLKALPDYAEFAFKIKDFSTTSDTEKVKEDFKYLLNYTNNNVIDYPLSYTKDMIVYNSSKIADYDFTSTPIFFDVTRVKTK